MDLTLTDEEFNAFLAALPQVYTAETEQEREAIFAFRYKVFGEELFRKLGTDPESKRTRDDEDGKTYTTLLYTADDNGITGTARIRHWEPGKVPAKDFGKLSMERFKGVERLRVAEIERLILRPDQRGGLTVAALGLAIFYFGKPYWYLDLMFCSCLTGLIPYYLKMGWRRYAGRLIPTPDGIGAPLVMVPSDIEHLRSVGSFFAPLVEREGLNPLNIAPFSELFEEPNLPVQIDKELVRAAVQGRVATAVGFLAGISAEAIEVIVELGFVIHVPAGELITMTGLTERELFVIIDGEFECLIEERSLRRVSGGEVVGEVAFFSSDGRRSASIRSICGGRVLAIPGRAIDELCVSAPLVAAELLFHLARSLADRTGHVY